MQCGDMRLHLDKLQGEISASAGAYGARWTIHDSTRCQNLLQLCGQKQGRFGYRGKLSDDVAAGQVSSRTANQLAGLGA